MADGLQSAGSYMKRAPRKPEVRPGHGGGRRETNARVSVRRGERVREHECVCAIVCVCDSTHVNGCVGECPCSMNAWLCVSGWVYSNMWMWVHELECECA